MPNILDYIIAASNNVMDSSLDEKIGNLYTMCFEVFRCGIIMQKYIYTYNLF